LKIIWQEVHSFIDLVDILGEDCIFENEYSEIFSSLGNMELAMLLKDFDLHLLESEKEWHSAFTAYLNSINSARMKEIIEISNRLARK